jgi:hypothetical protein
MSNIVEEHIENVVTTVVSDLNSVKEVVQDIKETVSNIVDTSISKVDEIIVDITKINFNQVFENFLNQSEEHLKKFNITLTPEMKKYFLLLCKDKPEFFNDVESSLKKIIMDDKIDTKDIPEIIILVKKVYEIINGDKKVPKVDPYELIKTLLQQLFIIYTETNKIQKSELVVDLVSIIEAAINLVKLKSIKVPKVGCFSSIFKI